MRASSVSRPESLARSDTRRHLKCSQYVGRHHPLPMNPSSSGLVTGVEDKGYWNLRILTTMKGTAQHKSLKTKGHHHLHKLDFQPRNAISSRPWPEVENDHAQGSYFTHPNELNYSSITPGLRIIGGKDASPHAYPYQVGIYVAAASRNEFCGGSLVSLQYVLTAAHCADVADKMELVFGAHAITATEDTQVRMTVTKSQFIIHPNWKRSTMVNDIALVKLSSPIKETSAIKVVKLASGSSAFAGNKGIVAGWGMTFNKQQNVTPTLKYIISSIMTNDDCKKVSADYKNVVKPSIICLSGQGHVGTCLGDSGGPLVVDGVQIGIVSFGYKDCTAGFPSVFTRLTEYKEWIAKNSDVKY